MATARQPKRATVDDLYHTPGKAELVNGELVLMPPTGVDPGQAATAISVSLYTYANRTGQGCAFEDNVGFLVNLPNRQSFSPDAAYCAEVQRGMKFYQGAPTFAVEVRSENDDGPAAERVMATKRADYFAAGTLVVWDVDLLSEDVVRVYRHDAPDHPRVYRRSDEAEAEPAVPGWSMPVEELFLRGVR
jgi:Uma2 family endonuclease